MSQHIESINDNEFENRVLKADMPVLIDFWAEWCAPCKKLIPVFEAVAEEYQDRVIFVKINIDQNPETPVQLGVKSIPTLVLFKNGSELARNIGTVTKTELAKFLDDHI